jgi:hypothetical protein
MIESFQFPLGQVFSSARANLAFGIVAENVELTSSIKSIITFLVKIQSSSLPKLAYQRRFILRLEGQDDNQGIHISINRTGKEDMPTISTWTSHSRLCFEGYFRFDNGEPSKVNPSFCQQVGLRVACVSSHSD